MFVENVRQALRPNPRRLLHKGTIQHQHFLRPRSDFLIDLCAGEVGKYQQRSGRMPRHNQLHLLQQKQNFLLGAVAEVDAEHYLPLVLQKSQPVVDCRIGERVVKAHASNPSTTP